MTPHRRPVRAPSAGQASSLPLDPKDPSVGTRASTHHRRDATLPPSAAWQADGLPNGFLDRTRNPAMATSTPTRSLPDVIEASRTIPECQSWLNPFRDAGRARFKELGWPGKRNESWRFTNLDRLTGTNFVSAVDDAEVSSETMASFAIPGLDATTLVFVNGRFREELSDATGELEPGVLVLPLSEAICQHREKVEPHLGRITADTDEAFTALNNASIENGVFVHVAGGVTASRPVHVLSVATRTDEPVASHPRGLVVAERNASVVVLEHAVGTPDAGVSLTNAVTEVFADHGANVDHYFLEREGREAFHVASLFPHLGEYAWVKSHTVLLGGGLVRNNVSPVLAGTDCECVINGLYVGDGTQHLDNVMRVHHAAPGCRSRQFYKGILNGNSRGVFTGRIVVDPAAQQTDAVQSNRNLLLSEGARVNARPQLEIFADDVKCTHGCTTGEVDPDAVFYFRSRGLDEPTARAMLIYAFAAEGFQRMDLQPVRQLLAAEMIAKLPGAEKLSIEV